MQSFGIDISRWQKGFDLAKAKRDEKIEFVIIKAGGGDDGLYKDSSFDSHYANAKACGLKIGAYFYSKATTVEQANSEADKMLEIIKGKAFDMPIYYDVEEKVMTSLDKLRLTSIICAFCGKIQQAGYKAGVYSNAWVINKCVTSNLKSYSMWIAAWTYNKPKLDGGLTVDVWQFGGETNLQRSNKINGITVDQDYCYVDFGSVSNDNKQEANSFKPNVEYYRMAVDVIDGKYGNGPERKEKLGSDYKRVQQIVNQIMEGK